MAKPKTKVYAFEQVMEAALAVIRGQARRIDLKLTIDGAEYLALVYRQIDSIVRVDFKTPKPPKAV